MPGPTDRNDPTYANDPTFVFSGGRWQKLSGGPTAQEKQDGHYTDSKGREIPIGEGTGGTYTMTEKGPFDGMGHAFDQLAGALGYMPKQVDVNAPGGTLDTSMADEERARLRSILSQLQAQAATGGGAWEGSLRDATQKASDNVQALGQLQANRGGGYASSVRGIGNAQGANQQRTVGQGNILRNQSKVAAQDAITGLLGQQGTTDANQAAADAAAKQGVSELNATLANNANTNITKDTSSGGGMLSMIPGMSDGGRVPGKPRVFGDDSANDTVSAKLSPGEIVIPRSHAHSPEAAADFVRALQAHKGRVHHFDSGGTVPGDGSGLKNPDPNSAETARAREAGAVSIFLPHIGAAMRQQKTAAPSVWNGGLFDDGAYMHTRSQMLDNANLLQQRANGLGPSVAPQQIQNAADEGVASGMQAQASGRRAPAGDVLNQVGSAIQSRGGDAAVTAANEQAAGQQSVTRALSAQRAQDNAFAQAQQQAAFRQTQMNAGLGIEQQNQLRGLLAGAGQAAAAGSNLFSKSDKSFDLSDTNTPGFDQGVGSMSEPSDWDNPYERGPADLHDSNDLAHGGMVEDTRGRDFVEALRRQGYR